MQNNLLSINFRTYITISGIIEEYEYHSLLQSDWVKFVFEWHLDNKLTYLIAVYDQKNMFIYLFNRK